MNRIRLLGIIAGLYSLGMGVLGYYQRWWWYDNLAHLLAGISLGGLLTSEDNPGIIDMGIVLTIAIAWELFEHRLSVFPWKKGVPKDYQKEDTLLDIILVMLGAAIPIRAKEE